MGAVHVALDQFVLKVHSRCDLACDHCYVYEAADQSWRGRPKAIPDKVLTRAAQRIAEHATRHDLKSVQIVLHGGEPLLLGVTGLRRVITELHFTLRDVCQLDLRIHTNGVQLSQAFCELFEEYGVQVGISIDGDRVANDRHRRYADGRSSYDQVVRAVELLRSGRFRPLFAGLLCTIDIANDPVSVYEALMALQPPRVDFLLPHATWDDPPPRTPGRQEQYANWLMAIFDRWLTDGRPASIRTFESILSTSTGGDSFTEALGLAPATLAVIETDGSYEQVDSLKVSYDGAPGTDLNVFRDELDAVAAHPGIAARQQGVAGLSQTCQACPVVSSCGGGLYTHRYRSGSGFDNPSVFCADLLKLITHVRQRLPEAPSSHGMPDAEFRDLAAGRGSAAAVGQLLDAQRTLRRTLLTRLYQVASGHLAVGDSSRSGLRTAWTVLAAVDREHPEALTRVLDHPFVRSCAVRALAELQTPSPGADSERAESLESGLGYLSALAASAAVRAGVSAEVRVPVVDGVVPLPTLGRLVPGPGQPELTSVRLIVGPDVVQFQAGRDDWKLAVSDLTRTDAGSILLGNEQRTAEWQATRVLRAAGHHVLLEDGDPFRDCYPARPASRMSDTQFAGWQRAFARAWTEIETSYPAYRPALAAGLSVLVPLVPRIGPDDTGAAQRHAFGAVAISESADPADWARSIVAAFQRAKLGAILDFCDLQDPDFPDVASVAGALTDAYTELAVGLGDEAGPIIDWLASHGGLTPLGHRFVAEMRQSVLAVGPVRLN